ncbi:hypothetical protein SteCoe_22266 [Stentor coeruleus]|uniref:IBB domain-containing protein n=1 Tax=Stentor coeruleus TaxID=5963 RepID=A0A1R2BMT6_9CILI|nr:hypothetical protein SteCoe_22266 [Stentor coeruleus]
MDRVVERKNDFQKLNVEKISQDRHKFAVELRKSKRKELLQKRRAPSILITTLTLSDTIMDIPEPELFKSLNLDPFTLIQALHNSENISDYIVTLQKINMQISKSPVSIEEYIKLGLIEIAIPHINANDNFELKNTAYWIICNIASGPSHCCERLFEFDIISSIFKELETQNSELYEVLFWILGNFIAESPDIFQSIVDKNFFLITLKCVIQSKIPKTLGIIAWSLKNAAHYDYLLEDNHLDTFTKLAFEILEYDSLEIRRLIIESMTILIRKDNEKIDFVIHSQFLYRSIEVWYIKPLHYHILKLCTNVCSGKNVHIQVLIDLGYLNLLEEVLRSKPNEDEIFLVFYSLSNIAAGGLTQLSALEKHTIFDLSLDGIICQNEKIQSEAAYYVMNYTMQSTREAIEELAMKHFLKKIANGFGFAKSNDAIMNLLRAYDKVARVADKSTLLAEDCINALNSLQKHKNSEIYRKSDEILEKYYSFL